MEPDLADLREIVQRALDEDLGTGGDCTTRMTIEPECVGSARILAKRAGVVCGLAAATAAFLLVDQGIKVELQSADGDHVGPGTPVLTVSGLASSLLAAERTALNFLQRLSGIATLTHSFVKAVRDTKAQILDTRKTTPGLRLLEKYAVRTGGGENHRFGLFDQVLLKENHFALAAPLAYEEVVRRAVAGSIAEGLRGPVIAEARTADEARNAVRGGAGVILLDNFRAEALRDAVAGVQAEARTVGRAVETEASGGIDLNNVRDVALCGVDRISIGALTHSAPALDLSMLVWSLQ